MFKLFIVVLIILLKLFLGFGIPESVLDAKLVVYIGKSGRP